MLDSAESLQLITEDSFSFRDVDKRNGERIYQLINNYRPSALDPETRQFIEKEIEKFFFGDGSAPPPGFTPSDTTPLTPTQ